jgi:hypothetical protein
MGLDGIVITLVLNIPPAVPQPLIHPPVFPLLLSSQSHSLIDEKMADLLDVCRPTTKKWGERKGRWDAKCPQGRRKTHGQRPSKGCDSLQQLFICAHPISSSFTLPSSISPTKNSSAQIPFPCWWADDSPFPNCHPSSASIFGYSIHPSIAPLVQPNLPIPLPS